MYRNANKRIVKKHALEVDDQANNYRQLTVFFISDIHRRKIDNKLLKKINVPIDLVIVGGDLAEKGVALQRIESNIQKLTQLGPLFYVWGNNDREVGEQNIRTIMENHNSVILENNSLEIPGHPKWGIFGTEEVSSRNVNINETLKDKDDFRYSILVCHQPKIIDQVGEMHIPTLALAGHTHGGQIRLGKLGLLEKGRYSITNGNATLISNGYGTSAIPLRLGADPESHIITITYSNA